jgi:hypothetical protein
LSSFELVLSLSLVLSILSLQGGRVVLGFRGTRGVEDKQNIRRGDLGFKGKTNAR